jgi:hypothetical protein
LIALIALDPKNKWRSYRRYRFAWWLSLAVLLACAFFAPIEATLFAGLWFFAYSLFIPYIACPLCGFQTGYNGHAKFNLLRPSPLGGWCRSCGERLFLRHGKV